MCRRNPNPRGGSAAKRVENAEIAARQAAGIPSFKCDNARARCGFEGVEPYHHAPKTTYQQRARRNASQDLQQFTRPFLEKKVARWGL